MTAIRTSRPSPAVIALAPVVLAAALVAHPYLAGRLPNGSGVADAVVAGTTRWGWVHLATVVASALVILAFVALRDHLENATGKRLAALAVPCVVIGSTLYALLPGMEFTVLAAAETGGSVNDIAAAQAALRDWFVPVLVTSGLIFAIGVLGFIPSVTRAALLTRPMTTVVVGALAVMGLSRLVPLAAVQLYVHSAAAMLGLLPLAYRFSTAPRPAPEGHRARAGHRELEPLVGERAGTRADSYYSRRASRPG